MTTWKANMVFNSGDEFVNWLRKEYPNTVKNNIKEVHMHHTWSPDHHTKGSTLQLAKNMRNYHMNHNGWNDIAQHVSLGKDGKVVLGRYIGTSPASATGYNGSKGSHPFMFETIGNFDVGHDKLEGAQLQTVLAILHFFVDENGKRLKFHNEMSGKTCPGSGINKQALLKEVHAYNPRKVAGSVTVSSPKKDEVVKPTVINGDFVGKRAESIYNEPVNFYNKPSWDEKDRAGTVKKGYGFPTVLAKLKVGGGYQYQVKNSKGATYYITTSSKFVKLVGGKQTVSIEQLAKETIDGKHGSGEARKKALGGNYNAVQKRVNELLGASKGKSIDEMAKEIINNPKVPKGHSARRKWLGVSTATYAKVRKRVNQIL